MKYYELNDNRIIAVSARGIYQLDGTEWFQIGFDIRECEQLIVREISSDEIAQRINRLKRLIRRSDYIGCIREMRLRNEIHQALEGSEYLYKLPVVRHLVEGKAIDFSSPVTIFVGENGSGKSTLLEAIAVSLGYNAEGGGLNYDFETRRSHSDLYKMTTLSRVSTPKDGFFLRAESFYNLATSLEHFGEEGYLGEPGFNREFSLHNMSHGESFLKLARQRFRNDGVYILDEPEAALSPKKVLELMKIINNTVNKNSQFIIATHSPILMTYPGARIYECTKKGLVEKGYKELEHFTFMREFLLNPEQILGSYFD